MVARRVGTVIYLSAFKVLKGSFPLSFPFITGQ